MARYISVPTEIEAVQFVGDNFDEVRVVAGTRKYMGGFTYGFQPIGTYLIEHLHPNSYAELWVEANQQWLPIEIGEWILRDAVGAYPCKDEMFRQKYREM